MGDQRERNDDPLRAAHGGDRSDDPLGVEADHDKRGEGLPDEGPPVAQMATTYGSSFIDSEEQADAVAEEPSGPTGPPTGDGGNPGGPTDAAPVEPAPQKTLDPGGERSG